MRWWDCSPSVQLFVCCRTLVKEALLTVAAHATRSTKSGSLPILSTNAVANLRQEAE